MVLATPSRREHPLAAYASCMNACEACVIACSACSPPPQGSAWAQDGPTADLEVCIQLCQLAVHAMARRAAMVPAACAACARSCEALAHACMLLGDAEHRRCARACYRAAQECYRHAALRRHEPAEALAA